VWTEDQFQAVAEGSGAGRAKKKAPAKKAPAKKAPAKKAPAKKAAAKVEEQEEEAEEEEEAPRETKKKPAAKKAKRRAASDDEDEAEEEEKPTVKKVKPEASGERRGPRVDARVPGKDGMSVYEDYSVTLNQTNIDGNNNKYYIIQVLQGGGKYYAWNRWGRVGEPGQNKLSAFSDPGSAIKAFESKFREKTVNHWRDRDHFVKHAGPCLPACRCCCRCCRSLTAQNPDRQVSAGGDGGWRRR
jgi:poly [ADP-ribose] polymerase